MGVGVVSAYAAPAPSSWIVWRCGRRSVPVSPPLLCSVHAHPSHLYHLLQAAPFPPLVFHIPYPLRLPSLPLWSPPCRRLIISPWLAIPFPRAPSIPCFHAMVLGSFMDWSRNHSFPGSRRALHVAVVAALILGVLLSRPTPFLAAIRCFLAAAWRVRCTTVLAYHVSLVGCWACRPSQPSSGPFLFTCPRTALS